MSSKPIFYHAGCPVCVTAEQQLVGAIQGSVEIVHLGENKNRLDEALQVGVKSVPALVIDGNVFHINYGAGIDALG